MSFLWNCCALSEEPTEPVACDALDDGESTDEYTLDVEASPTGTMWGDGYNYHFRSWATVCGGEYSTCGATAFLWSGIAWNDPPTDPTICEEDYCTVDAFGPIDPGAYSGSATLVVDRTGCTDTDSDSYVSYSAAGSVEILSLVGCHPLDLDDLCGAADASPLPGISQAVVRFTWSDTISVDLKNDDCTTTTNREVTATNTWECYYYRINRTTERIAVGEYHLFRCIWSTNTACGTAGAGGDPCTEADQSPTNDVCRPDKDSAFPYAQVLTLWQPPESITVIKSA